MGPRILGAKSLTDAEYAFLCKIWLGDQNDFTGGPTIIRYATACQVWLGALLLLTLSSSLFLFFGESFHYAPPIDSLCHKQATGSRKGRFGQSCSFLTLQHHKPPTHPFAITVQTLHCRVYITVFKLLIIIFYYLRSGGLELRHVHDKGSLFPGSVQPCVHFITS
ncbi:hypothetical protein TNCV_789931 [Trichonephila clavipes]|nr:hypothetical protein TNCV_789931 [Trichonephila clavipes]